MLTCDQAWRSGTVEFVDKDVSGVFPEFVDKDVSGVFPEFYDITDVAGAPTGVGLYGGRFAHEVQASWTDEQIVAGALEVLATAYAGEIPAPTAAGVTRWTNAPFALGSDVFLAPGTTPGGSGRHRKTRGRTPPVCRRGHV